MPAVHQQEEAELVADTGAGAGLEGGIVSEGELGCLLVFSDRRHVHYINALLSQLESVLRSRGFRPQRLGEEIRSGEDYLEKLTGLVEDSVLGVVILDGFRPNVLFEFGYLMGKKKPTIVLMCEDACVSVKTLYGSREESGLGQRAFHKLLQDPPVDLSSHLSDFGGKHVARMDWGGRETEPTHPCVVLHRELSKLEDTIVEEAGHVVGREIPSAALQPLLEPLATVVGYYYMDPGRVATEDLRRAHEELVETAVSQGVELPYDVYAMIGGAYASRAGVAPLDAAQVVACLESALAVYGELSRSAQVREEPRLRADNRRRTGDISWKLAQYRARRDNSQRAVSAYEEALRVYTLEDFPMDYGMTQNNLGAAYGTLAEVEEKGENCGRAIGAYEEALRVYTLEDFPMDYGMTQNNLGTAYSTLAEVEEKGENCRRALEAYRQALGVYTEELSAQVHAEVAGSLARTLEGVCRDQGGGE